MYLVLPDSYFQDIMIVINYALQAIAVKVPGYFRTAAPPLKTSAGRFPFQLVPTYGRKHAKQD